MHDLLRRVPALLAATCLLVVLAPWLGQSSSAADPAGAPRFGVQFHGMWNSYDDTQRTLFLDQLAASGATEVRIDVSWAMLQPLGPDSYDLKWGVPFVDRVITMATDRGLTPLITLWMTPDWANGGAGARTLPHDPQDYARAARWAAARWASQVPAWEIWNEPNLEHFMTGADPVAYTGLLRAAYPAIKAGNPDATVVFGGPSSNDTPWLERAYGAGAGGSFDVMATHPYQGIANLAPETPDDGSKYHFTHLKGVHELMVRNGDGHKPIWATEFGWSSHPNTGTEKNWELGVTEAQQGDYLVRALELVEREMPYVTHLFWYTDRDFSTSNPQNGNYGLFYNDLRPKPAYHAVKAYLATRSAPVATPEPELPEPAPVPAGADVAVEISGPSTGTAGGSGSYEVTVSNQADSGSASLVTVRGDVPDGHTIAGLHTPATSDWTCVVDLTTYLCTTGSPLTAGTSAPPITLEVAYGAGSGPAGATARVSSSSDVDPGNDTGAVTTRL